MTAASLPVGSVLPDSTPGVEAIGVGVPAWLRETGRALTAVCTVDPAVTPPQEGGEAAVVDGEAAAVMADVRGAVGGDHQAFSRLVSRYQPAVAAQMWRFTRIRADYEELVGDVFVEAYFSLPRYRGDAPLLHWLLRIATRVGYRYWKRRDRRRARGEVSLEECSAQAVEKASENPAEAAEVVHRLLAQLPPRDRLVLTLVYLEQRSIAEAAALTGWSETMVKVQAHRARRKLKKLVG